MTAQHTPTPWHVNDLNTGMVLIDANVSEESTVGIAEMNGTTEQDKIDAAFIIRACNSHDELVNAAKGLLKLVDELTAAGFIVIRDDDGEDPQVTAMRTTLAKAGAA